MAWDNVIRSVMLPPYVGSLPLLLSISSRLFPGSLHSPWGG